jgi:hypothetical protein
MDDDLAIVGFELAEATEALFRGRGVDRQGNG